MARRASKTGQTRIRRNLEAIMPLTRQIFSLVKYYVICVAVVLLLSNFVAKPVVIRGTSMNPTLENFDFALSNRLSIVLGGRSSALTSSSCKVKKERSSSGSSAFQATRSATSTAC